MKSVAITVRLTLLATLLELSYSECLAQTTFSLKEIQAFYANRSIAKSDSILRTKGVKWFSVITSDRLQTWVSQDNIHVAQLIGTPDESCFSISTYSSYPYGIIVERILSDLSGQRKMKATNERTYTDGLFMIHFSESVAGGHIVYSIAYGNIEYFRKHYPSR